jgi:hypothetical protein
VGCQPMGMINSILSVPPSWVSLPPLCMKNDLSASHLTSWSSLMSLHLSWSPYMMP